jgi:hypothetical protein
MATHVHTRPPLSGADRLRLGRRAQLLAGASVAYNVVEAVVAVTAGLVAGSVALIGFGLDSVVEVSSGLIVLWQFRHRLPESREAQALRLMAVSFFVLAAYVSFASVRALLSGSDRMSPRSASGWPSPRSSSCRSSRGRNDGPVERSGPTRSWPARRRRLLCTYLSAVLLAGLV